MKTLIVYDNTGYVLYYITGYYRIPQGGIQFMEVENVPQNQYVLSVDVSMTPHAPVYGIPDFTPEENGFDDPISSDETESI